MKRIIIVAILLLLGAANVTAQSKTDKSVERELLRLHRAEDEAEAKKDTNALERLFSDDFLFVAANGAIYDKKKFLGEIKADTEPPTEQKLDYENFRARIYGKTAIVNYVLVVNGTDKDKKAYANRFQMSVVWIKEKGVWRIANFHSTRLRA
ncbi:MAG TPA: nuclear transport factor 2 family protein [Pyrinomonadaceae bacterium]|jgi:hypothetical protein